MRTDRLYAITVYLLNHGKTSASELARKFEIYCKAEARAKAIEYLNGKVTAEYSNGDCDMTLYVVENEYLWFGTILALGDGIIIKAPERIRKRIVDAAERIISLYK